MKEFLGRFPSTLKGGWWSDFALFAFSIIFPTLALFKKLPWPLLPIYTVTICLVLFLSFTWVIPCLARKLTSAHCWSFGIVLLGILLVAHLIIHPLIDTEGFSAFGTKFGASDSDDAIDIGIEALLNGSYPYYQETFIDNPITPLPGALLLAMPFYLLGDSSVQSFAWYGVFWLILWKKTSDIRIASVLLGIMTFLSPNLVYHICTGSDYIANSIYILVAMVFLMRLVDRNWFFVAPLGVLFGITLASRPNWFLLLPIAFFYMAHRTSFSKATGVCFVVCCTIVVLVIPFYLYDPEHFSPFHVHRLLTIGNEFPSATALITISGFCLSLFLSIRDATRSIIRQVRSSSHVQSFVIACGFALAWIAEGAPNLSYSHFGVLFMFFGIFATGPSLTRFALSREMPKGIGAVAC